MDLETDVEMDMGCANLKKNKNSDVAIIYQKDHTVIIFVYNVYEYNSKKD